MSQRVDQSSQSNPNGRKIPQSKNKSPNIQASAAVKTVTKRVPTTPVDNSTLAAMTSFANRLSGDDRRRMIAESAYYRAEKRGFGEGNEVDDWLAAEAEINQKFPE